MATINATGAATTVDPARPFQQDKVFLLQNKIDFSRTASGQLFSTQADNSDVLQVLRVLAGWAVMWVATRVTTAATGASTITADLGDGGDPNGWDDDIDFTSTGYSISAVGTDAYAIGSPKVYSSDDTLDYTLTVSGGDGGPIDTGVIYVTALVFDLSDVSDVRLPAVV